MPKSIYMIVCLAACGACTDPAPTIPASGVAGNVTPPRAAGSTANASTSQAESAGQVTAGTHSMSTAGVTVMMTPRAGEEADVLHSAAGVVSDLEPGGDDALTGGSIAGQSAADITGTNGGSVEVGPSMAGIASTEGGETAEVIVEPGEAGTQRVGGANGENTDAPAGGEPELLNGGQADIPVAGQGGSPVGGRIDTAVGGQGGAPTGGLAVLPMGGEAAAPLGGQDVERVPDCVGPGDLGLAQPEAGLGMPTSVGASRPTWRLFDYQPLSCGFGATYGVDAFDGRPTLVALFNAGCGYCRAQASKLEVMRLELEVGGSPVHVLALNTVASEPARAGLAERCSFPLFQDIGENDAMSEMAGGVYDFYIYDSSGVLHAYLENGTLNTDLSNDEGYANVKAALTSAAQNVPYIPPHPMQ